MNYTYYHDILLPQILAKPEVIYLRSTNQKRLFARKRLSYLKRAIAKYCQKQTVSSGGVSWQTRKTTSFAMEIEFDHFVTSLRSSIEHLLQLINFVAGLGLCPTTHDRARAVDADNIVRCLRSQSSPVLTRLGNYLQREKNQDWYKMLHKLRIENYHNKFDKFINQEQNVRLKLPNNTEMDLVAYCSDATRNVERVLSYSLRSLTQFLGLSH